MWRIAIGVVLLAAFCWFIYDWQYRIPSGPRLPESPSEPEIAREAVELNRKATIAYTGFDPASGERVEGGLDPDEALRFLEEALRIDPRYHHALSFKAGVLASRDQFEDAAECLRRVVQLRPRHAEAYVGLAYAEHRLGNEKASRENLMKALSALNDRVETSSHARIDRAHVLYLLGRNAVARRELEAVGSPTADLLSEKFDEADDQWFMLREMFQRQ